MLSTARHSAGNEITVAVLLGCGLRRAELAAISVGDLQRREERWVFADLIGKGGHVRTVPVPDWAGSAIQASLTAAAVAAETCSVRSTRPAALRQTGSVQKLSGRS